MSWGRRPSCRCGECAKCKHAAYMREWYQRKSFEERQALRAGRDPDRVRRQELERHARMKDDPTYQRRRHAVQMVNNAIRDGRMRREPCEVCGDTAQAHHDNYDRPFDVRWLCTRHHAEEHTAEERQAA